MWFGVGVVLFGFAGEVVLWVVGLIGGLFVRLFGYLLLWGVWVCICGFGWGFAGFGWWVGMVCFWCVVGLVDGLVWVGVFLGLEFCFSVFLGLG